MNDTNDLRAIPSNKEELADVLTAISVVAKKLAKNITSEIEEEKKEGEEVKQNG